MPYEQPIHTNWQHTTPKRYEKWFCIWHLQISWGTVRKKHKELKLTKKNWNKRHCKRQPCSRKEMRCLIWKDDHAGNLTKVINKEWPINGPQDTWLRCDVAEMQVCNCGCLMDHSKPEVMIQGKGLLLFHTCSMILVPELYVCFIKATTKEATASKTIKYLPTSSLSVSLWEVASRECQVSLPIWSGVPHDTAGY